MRLTLLLRLRQGIQAEETAFRFADFGGAMLANPSVEPCSSLGRIVLGGITGQWQRRGARNSLGVWKLQNEERAIELGERKTRQGKLERKKLRG